MIKWDNPHNVLITWDWVRTLLQETLFSFGNLPNFSCYPAESSTKVGWDWQKLSPYTNQYPHSPYTSNRFHLQHITCENKLSSYSFYLKRCFSISNFLIILRTSDIKQIFLDIIIYLQLIWWTCFPTPAPISTFSPFSLKTVVSKV